MSAPSRNTCPVMRAPGTVSCMRLRQRRKVDLPHPDGPMTAVTERSRNCTLASRTACIEPKYALSASTRTCGGSAWRATSAATGIAEFVTSASLSCAVALSRSDTSREADDEDDGDEDEGARPGLRVPFVVWTNRIVENLKRK